MKISEYQELSKRTMPKPYGKNLFGEEKYSRDNIVNYIMGATGELGEFIDLLKKNWFHGHPVTHDEIKKEMGDVFHYIFGLCQMLGYSAEEIATMNIMTLQKRYPNGFSVEDSIKRVDVK
jgi:NTP pyrophosphatase (non-canonical NTP hydrolase)